MQDVKLRLVHVEYDSMIELRVEGEKVRRMIELEMVPSHKPWWLGVDTLKELDIMIEEIKGETV